MNKQTSKGLERSDFLPTCAAKPYGDGGPELCASDSVRLITGAHCTVAAGTVIEKIRPTTVLMVYPWQAAPGGEPIAVHAGEIASVGRLWRSETPREFLRAVGDAANESVVDPTAAIAHTAEQYVDSVLLESGYELNEKAQAIVGLVWGAAVAHAKAQQPDPPAECRDDLSDAEYERDAGK